MSAANSSDMQCVVSSEKNHETLQTAGPRKGLTVTFQDVSIEVHGMGEDYGSTCLSVVKDMFTSVRSDARSTRVGANLPVFELLKAEESLLTNFFCSENPPGRDWSG